MTRITIAYLPARLTPAGAERQMLTLAERLPRDRFEVHFVILAGRGELEARATAAGAHIHHLGDPAARDAAWPVRAGRRLSKVAQYVALARAERFDIVDAWLYPTDVLVALTRPLTGVPVVMSGRRNVDPQRQFGPVEGSVERLLDRLIDLVVANSEAAAANAIATQHVDPHKMRIIHNGVEIPDLVAADERLAIRHRLGAADDDIVIGCVGNYRDVKRLDRLVAAFAEIARSEPRVRLELIGEGDLRPELERLIRPLGLADRICLHGSVPDAVPLYPAFDVVAQSSEREGLPNALLEAGAAGRAIVATAAGGTSEIVIDGETGLLVPVDDQEAFVRALRMAVADAALRDRLGDAVRRHVATTFGMERFIAGFADVYETLAARNAPRHRRTRDR